MDEVTFVLPRAYLAAPYDLVQLFNIHPTLTRVCWVSTFPDASLSRTLPILAFWSTRLSLIFHNESGFTLMKGKSNDPAEIPSRTLGALKELSCRSPQED